MDVLEVPAMVLADELAGHLGREIVVRDGRDWPLTGLAEPRQDPPVGQGGRGHSRSARHLGSAAE
jgi:hypothetical protein